MGIAVAAGVPIVAAEDMARYPNAARTCALHWDPRVLLIRARHSGTHHFNAWVILRVKCDAGDDQLRGKPQGPRSASPPGAVEVPARGRELMFMRPAGIRGQRAGRTSGTTPPHHQPHACSVPHRVCRCSCSPVDTTHARGTATTPSAHMRPHLHGIYPLRLAGARRAVFAAHRRRKPPASI